jgi:hypothetical protein
MDAFTTIVVIWSEIDASHTFDSSIRWWHIDHGGLFSHQNLSATCTWLVTRTLFLDFKATGRYSRINSTESLALRAFNVGKSRLISQVIRIHVNQCVSAVRAAEMPIFACSRSSCNRDWGRRTVSFVRQALKLVMQNDGDFVDVTLIYINVQKLLCFLLFLITVGALVSVVENHKGILLHSVFSVFNSYVFHY